MRSFFHFLRTSTKSSITHIRAQAFFPLPRPLRKPFFEKSFFITQIRVQALPIPTETNWRFMISARITQIRVQAFSDRVRAEYEPNTEPKNQTHLIMELNTWTLIAVEPRWRVILCIRENLANEAEIAGPRKSHFEHMFLIFLSRSHIFHWKSYFKKKSRNSRRT